MWVRDNETAPVCYSANVLHANNYICLNYFIMSRFNSNEQDGIMFAIHLIRIYLTKFIIASSFNPK